MKPLHIRLLVTNYAGVSGLSRYAAMLYRQLQVLPGVKVEVTAVPPPPAPGPLLHLARRIGFDVGTFLQTYPLTWPMRGDGLVHLTHRGQASVLWRKRRQPVVVTAHDIIHYQYRRDPSMHTYRNVIASWFDALAVRGLRNADAVLASSEYTRQALIQEAGLSADRVHRIYLGVDRAQFKPRQVPPSFFARYGLEPRWRYIVHISTDERRKNLPLLVSALAAVRARHPDVSLLKIGRPLYPAARQELRAHVSELGLDEAVLFVDDVPDEDLPYFYSVGRFLALPSRAEGFGFPVLEAMACGTPVVCSNVTSLPELAGDAALLVDPMDVQALTQAMTGLLEDETLWTTCRQRGLQRAAAFPWSRTAQETARVYAMAAEAVSA